MDMNLEASEGSSSEQTIFDEEHGLVEFEQENEEITEAEPVAGRLAKDYSVHQLKAMQTDLQAQKDTLIAKGKWNLAESESAQIQSLLEEIEKNSAADGMYLRLYGLQSKFRRASVYDK